MKLRAALNYYLSNYDLIYTDIIGAIIGKPTKDSRVFDKTIGSEKLQLRNYLSKIMLEN